MIGGGVVLIHSSCASSLLRNAQHQELIVLNGLPILARLICLRVTNSPCIGKIKFVCFFIEALSVCRVLLFQNPQGRNSHISSLQWLLRVLVSPWNTLYADLRNTIRQNVLYSSVAVWMLLVLATEKLYFNFWDSNKYHNYSVMKHYI